MYHLCGRLVFFFLLDNEPNLLCVIVCRVKLVMMIGFSGLNLVSVGIVGFILV